MSELKLGYAKVNINPMLGIGIYGYYVPRFAKGFLDDLEAHVLAASCGDETVLMFSIHAGSVQGDPYEQYIKKYQKQPVF